MLQPPSSQGEAPSQSEGARAGPFIFKILRSLFAPDVPTAARIAAGRFVAGRSPLLLALGGGLAVLHAGRRLALGRSLAAGRGPIEIPLGNLSLTQPTTHVNFSGNLNSAGTVAANGSVTTSNVFFSDAAGTIPAVATDALTSL